MGLIDCGGEAVRLGKALERFAPGTLMRGCEQDAIDVENARGQPLGTVGLGSRGFADGHELTHSGRENGGALHPPARRSTVPGSGPAKVGSETTQPIPPRKTSTVTLAYG